MSLGSQRCNMLPLMLSVFWGPPVPRHQKEMSTALTVCLFICYYRILVFGIIQYLSVNTLSNVSDRETNYTVT